MTPNESLARMGLTLPAAAAPAANYTPFVRTGAHLYISGQVCKTDAETINGILGIDLDVTAGVRAAFLCGLNLISQMREALDGRLDRVVRVVKLGGFIQVGPDFLETPIVMNGCSDLMVDVFGDAGRHARTTVGVYRLPSGFAVEVDAVVEVRD